jgi:hypothetical protein
MADANVPPEAQQHDDLSATLAARERELAVATARAQAMEETLQALNRPQQAAPLQPAPGKSYVIPPHIRQQIAAQGITDAEIEQNGDLIVPFIQAYLGQAAAEVIQMIQQQADEIQQFHMLRDIETYPHADTLFKEMTRIRKDEAKQGRYMNPETAYRIAVANNYERLGRETGTGEGQFQPRREPPTSPVAARSRDASAGQVFRTVRAPVTTPEKPVTRGDDLMEMSREERRAFFEQHGNTPIK